METIAVISDIHANIVALDAVLLDLEELRPDRVVCLGDVAATGPAPCEVITRLRDRDWSYVRGNCDDNVLRYAAGEKPSIGDEHDQIDQWCASRLTADDLELLSSFEPYVSLTVGATGCCFFHGSPRSNLDIILAETAGEELDRLFDGLKADFFAGGHTHVQMARCHRQGYVINPGSVGLPFAYTVDGREINPLWAEYAIVRIDGARIAVELRRTAVD